MDELKRLKNGQAIQENMEPSGMELAPALTPTGDALKLSFADGKSGTTESIGLPQTDYTNQSGGPDGENSADSL